MVFGETEMVFWETEMVFEVQKWVVREAVRK